MEMTVPDILRLTAIEKQLGERTRELLSIPVQRSTKRKNEPER